MNKLDEYLQFKKQFETKSNIDFVEPIEFIDTYIVQFKPTDHCNFKCSYCYVYDNHQIDCDEIMFNKYLTIVEKEICNKHYNRIFLYIYGGEPTMNKNLKHFINLFYKKFQNIYKIETLIQTNGHFFKTINKYEEFLIDLPKTLKFNISYHDEFANKAFVLKLSKYLKLHNRLDKISFMITESSVDKLQSFIKILKDCKIPIEVKSIFQESNHVSTKLKNILTLNSPQYNIIQNNIKFEVSHEWLPVNNIFNFNNMECFSGHDSLVLSTFGKIYRCDMDEIEKKNHIYDINISLNRIHYKKLCENTFCCTNFCKKKK